MIKRGKTMILLTMIFIFVLTGAAYGEGDIYPAPEDDLNFMQEKRFNNDNIQYSYYDLYIDGTLPGKLGKTMESKAKVPVYILNIEKEGMVSVEVTPLNKMFYAKAEINVYYVSSVTGEKRVFSPEVKTSLQVGPGQDQRTFYAYPGTYYITVSGSQYSQAALVTNDLTYLDFTIRAVRETYRNDPNGRDIVSDSNPFMVDIAEPVCFFGNVGMQYRWGGDRWYKDTNDVYRFTAPQTGQVKISTANIDSPVLRLFTKKIVMTRDVNNKSNWQKALADDWRDNAHLTGNVRDEGNMSLWNIKLNPGETDHGIFAVEAGKKYKINAGNDFPTAYKFELSYVGAGSQPQPLLLVRDGETATVFGSVTDEQGNPVYGLEVKFGAVTRTSDTAGFQNLKVPANREINIEIKAPGYKTGRWTQKFTAKEHLVSYVLEKEASSVLSPDQLAVNHYKMQQGKEYKGPLAMSQRGLVMTGDVHTNGRVLNGYRDGNRIETVDAFNIKNKTIYGAFTVFGTSYGAYTGLAVDNVTGGGYVSTHHSWAGSKVVADGTKVYKTLSFTDNTWAMTAATGNYYGRSGSILLEEKSGKLSEAAQEAINSPRKIIFVFGDNYGGANNYLVVNDLFMEDNH
ncbi:MAG: hypothetical protein ACOWWO_01390 [Peptococcaceae bacterium]